MTVPPGYTIDAMDRGYAYRDEQPVVSYDRCRIVVAEGPHLDLQAAVLAVWDHETAIHPRRT